MRTGEQMDRSVAGRVIRALRKGTVPAEYAAELRVGQERWHATALSMMADTAEDDDFEVRFVRGAYGGGKTLFLRCLEEEARRKGWVTAYVMMRHDLVELDRLDSIVREIAARIGGAGTVGLNKLLRRAMACLAGRCGFFLERSNSLSTLMKVDDVTKQYCSEFGLSCDITMALRAAMRAYVDADDTLWLLIVQWLSGGTQAVQIDPARLAISNKPVTTTRPSITLKPLGRGSAEEILRLFSMLVRLSGHVGLLLCFDELELVAGLSARRRENAFQTLRALIDSDSQLFPRSTCMFFAATPYMFEARTMFPSYKALQDRIEVLSTLGQRQITYREPIIDLDRTELQRHDLCALADKIVQIYSASGKHVPPNVGSNVEQLVEILSRTSYVVAKPRLLCRCTVDLLDGVLQETLQEHVAVVTNEMETARKREIFS